MSGWADSISKILNSTKPQNKKELILSRARKDYEIRQGKSDNESRSSKDTFEVIPSASTSSKTAQDEDEALEEVSKDSPENQLISLKAQKKLQLKQKKLDLAWENLARMNADTVDVHVERELLKIATKGVVQLFNAISMQQKSIRSKLKTARKSEFRKEKILRETKSVFGDALSKSKNLLQDQQPDVKSEEKEEEESGETRGVSVSTPAKSRSSLNQSKSRKRKVISTDEIDSGEDGTSEKKKSGWSVLRDDFMMDAKLKHWDKNDDSDSD